MAGRLTGTLNWSLTDLSSEVPAQMPLMAGTIPIQVDDRPISQILPLPTPHQGLYRFDAEMVWAGGGKDLRSLTLATIGAVPAYDASSREASPYGLNTHGGRSVNSPEAWNKAGLVWIRDYAWAFSAMLHARDEQGAFTGWPWYPKLLDRYKKHGLRLLPCLFDGIIPSDGTVPEVPVQWRRDMSAIFAAFPDLTFWELGNEWDLDAAEKHGGKLDRAKGFPSYRTSHKAFGQIVSAIGATAVENGRSGCFPEDIRAMVADGTFADIKVTNGHFYTGTATPELSISNANTAGGGTGLKYRICYQDLLRECQRASRADGKKRSFWLSEFGYDTKAGFVVSAFQQAIYLQRAWMLSFANHVEKSFWFYDYDEPKADAFFDGCGIMDETAQPKLSLCSLSALTRILPNPSYVGPIDAGPGTWGYLFEDHGKRVAALWMVDRADGPQVTFSSGRLLDFLGNPIAGNSVKLGLAPVFCVDVAPGDRLVKQACYEVDGLRFFDLSAGDAFTIPVAIVNHRTEALQGRLKLRLPEGWTSISDDQLVEAAPGAKAAAEFACVIAPNAKPGEFQVGVQIDEGGILCELRVRVLVRSAISISAPTLGNQPGATATAITVVNYSQRALDGEVTLQLPAGWKADPASLKVEQLAPDASRSLPVTITWDGSWRSGEEAWAQVTSKDGSTARVALQPGVITIPRLPSFTADGDLGEWPASALLPNWVVGCTSDGGANADIRLGWCERGLAIAVRAGNSLAQGRGPSTFWNMDATEVFVDSTGTFTQRDFTATDHQFWLVPQLEEKRSYLGRWKRNDEIPATLYDIPGMSSFAKATPDGYLYEAVIPAAQIRGFTPKVGAVLGLDLVLSVNSTTGKREVYWPWSKNDNPAAKPQTWGRVRLGE